MNQDKPNQQEINQLLARLVTETPTAEVRKLPWLIHIEGLAQFNADKVRRTLTDGGIVTFTQRGKPTEVSIRGDVQYCHIAYEGRVCRTFDVQVLGYAIIGGLRPPKAYRVPRSHYGSGLIRQGTQGPRLEL